MRHVRWRQQPTTPFCPETCALLLDRLAVLFKSVQLSLLHRTDPPDCDCTRRKGLRQLTGTQRGRRAQAAVYLRTFPALTSVNKRVKPVLQLLQESRKSSAVSTTAGSPIFSLELSQHPSQLLRQRSSLGGEEAFVPATGGDFSDSHRHLLLLSVTQTDFEAQVTCCQLPT